MAKTLKQNKNYFGEKVKLIHATFHGTALFFADKYWNVFLVWVRFNPKINTLNTEHKQI